MATFSMPGNDAEAACLSADGRDLFLFANGLALRHPLEMVEEGGEVSDDDPEDAVVDRQLLCSATVDVCHEIDWSVTEIMAAHVDAEGTLYALLITDGSAACVRRFPAADAQDGGWRRADLGTFPAWSLTVTGTDIFVGRYGEAGAMVDVIDARTGLVNFSLAPRGDGPGCVRDAAATCLLRDDTLLVADTQSRKIERYGATGEALGALALDLECTDMKVDRYGALLVADASRGVFAAFEAYLTATPVVKWAMRMEDAGGLAMTDPFKFFLMEGNRAVLVNDKGTDVIIVLMP